MNEKITGVCLTEDGSVPTVTEEQLPSRAEVENGSCCEKCGGPIVCHASLASRRCSWCASIGADVEIDPNWEVATDPELAPAATQNPLSGAKLPTWAWTLIGCVSGVIIESLAARLLIPADSAIRTYWSVTQLFTGFAIFSVCHSVAFALLMKTEGGTNLTDILLHPLLSWSLVLRELPRRQWVCHLGFGGLTAAAMAILVVGELPYERLLDWGAKPPPKTSLIGAVMSRTQEATDDKKTLEETVADRASTQNLDKDEKKRKKQKPAPQPRQTDDCIVLGYQTTSDGLIHSIHLGGENYGKLIYVGKVSPDLSVKKNRELAQQLSEITARRPFVKVPVKEAHWVSPNFVCRVSFKRKGKQGGLYGTKLEELVGPVELKTK
ncbi:MAG: hypothetical protein MK171_12025 [Pirellulales bacterium]|nr:hypothetical protein [Pirellulales bacterium]